MRLCDHSHGSLLVHRVHASGCDRPAPNRPFPHDGHHESWRCTVSIYTFMHQYVTAYTVPVCSQYSAAAFN